MVFQVEVVVVVVVVVVFLLFCSYFYYYYYCCFCPSGRHGQRVLESTCGLRRLTYIGDFHIEAPPRCFGLKLFASARIFGSLGVFLVFYAGSDRFGFRHWCAGRGAILAAAASDGCGANPGPSKHAG